jgi:WD repeat-containing protein 35
MFAYLSKKVNIPRDSALQSVSWNTQKGWIACCGDNGLLKVLQLDSKKSSSQQASQTQSGARRNLSMNQTLEGHHGCSVKCVTWNETHDKLTSSDEHGLIIVWKLHRGMWFEEMINNRNQSSVKCMKWTPDGRKICIVYEDGYVIVGSHDGNRVWGKDLGSMLSHAEWAPDGQMLLFSLLDGSVKLFDKMGTFARDMQIFAISPGSGASVAEMSWYDGSNGYLDPSVPKIAIGYDSGFIQIMRDVDDSNPILINTGLEVVSLKWNCYGSVLAVAGRQASGSTNSVVQFYNPYGRYLRTLRVPENGITSISWEGKSLRLSLAVGKYVFLANVRSEYNWTYINNSIVYTFNSPDRQEACAMFWNISSDERSVKYVPRLVAVTGYGDHCVFSTRSESKETAFHLILCNSIGTALDSQLIEIEPVRMAMTQRHIVAASDEIVYIWQYRSRAPKSKSKLAQQLVNESGKEVYFHVDDTDLAHVYHVPTSRRSLAGSAVADDNKAKARLFGASTSDPICSIAASETCLVVGRASGTIMRYTLPMLTNECQYVVRCRPEKMALNCDSTKLGIVDINGIFTLLDLDARPNGASGERGQLLKTRRKDVWGLRWSTDNPDLFALMEKGKMYIFRGEHPEEPVVSSAYLCEFSDLEVVAVELDEVMQEPETPSKDALIRFHTKSLRDTIQLLDTSPINEAHQYIKDHPHPRLWKKLAEKALEQLNFEVADRAFVSCRNYQGIQFVKRLKVLSSRQKQRAEVSAYFGRFEEAEQLYLEAGSKDLAVELRMRLGDWMRVVQLIQSGDAGDDKLLRQAHANIGHYYADRQKWDKATKYYHKAGTYSDLTEAAYAVDDFKLLHKVLKQVPDNGALLKNLGNKFMSVGLCKDAAAAFERAGDAKSAVDCCVLLNQWDKAVEYAEKHNMPQIQGLLTKYANHLMQKGDLFTAVELYRKANKHTEAAKLLGNLAQEAANHKMQPIRAKQLYVLAAIEVDSFRNKVMESTDTTQVDATMQTLQTLLDVDTSMGGGSKLQENPWHGAEAYHFFLLAQRQLYAGDVDSAMRTASRLREYEDALGVKEIYSLIALAAFHNGYFGQCSKAFVRLESEKTFTPGEREDYKKLAMSIFAKNRPVDPEIKKYPCPNAKCNGNVCDWDTSCDSCQTPLQACVASGRSLLIDDRDAVLQCKMCRHKAYRDIAQRYRHCPLCHHLLMHRR